MSRLGGAKRGVFFMYDSRLMLVLRDIIKVKLAASLDKDFYVSEL
jgi:hypothetical protein